MWGDQVLYRQFSYREAPFLSARITMVSVRYDRREMFNYLYIYMFIYKYKILIF